MTTHKTLRPLALACAAGLLFAATPTRAADSLWGGDAEWGGNRQTVSFNPQYQKGQIIVSFGDRRLYHVIAPGQAMSYPIAIPREQSRWEGVTSVTQKRENPSWTPTPEMIKENPRLPSWVPGGHPMNPLGVRAMYLGSSTYRIHGTDAPWTIGQAVSKGCIRMFNQDVQDLYPKIAVGTRVTVTWARFNAAPSSFAVAAGDDKPGKPAKAEKAEKVAKSGKAEVSPPVVSAAEAEKANGVKKASYQPASQQAAGNATDYNISADLSDEEARAARRKAILAKYMAQRKARSQGQQSSDASAAKPQKNAAVE
jgi:hypothetical protein